MSPEPAAAATLESRPPGPPARTSDPATPSRPARRRGGRRAQNLGLGIATLYLSVIVVIPLGAIVLQSQDKGFAFFWDAITGPQALAALRLTVVLSLLVATVNAVMGVLIAWVLVRDHFWGKRLVDAIIDLPFALPTIVAGLVLVSLYGPESPIGVNIAYTRTAVAVALAFVTLPFVVRTVQPVLLELDRDMEEAAASMGASSFTVFRRIVLPNLVPAIVAGATLSFARAIAEFGSTVLISGNLPFKTEVAPVFIYGAIQSDQKVTAAAVSTTLLVIALIVLLGLNLVQRWSARRGL